MPPQGGPGLPAHLRWTEDRLEPGYRLALVRSFRKSGKALDGLGPLGATFGHTPPHRRFPGLADTLDPVPYLGPKRGPKPSAHQMAGRGFHHFSPRKAEGLAGCSG